MRYEQTSRKMAGPDPGPSPRAISGATGGAERLEQTSCAAPGPTKVFPASGDGEASVAVVATGESSRSPQHGLSWRVPKGGADSSGQGHGAPTPTRTPQHAAAASAVNAARRAAERTREKIRAFTAAILPYRADSRRVRRDPTLPYSAGVTGA